MERVTPVVIAVLEKEEPDSADSWVESINCPLRVSDSQRTTSKTPAVFYDERGHS